MEKVDSTLQIPVVILVRVSTAKQETARQISELQGYADSKNYRVVEVCQETVSGRANETDRHGLNRCLELARIGLVRKVLVHEISRIARKNSIAHRFVEELEKYSVSLYWHAQGIETLMANGKRNPSAGIMLAEMGRGEVEVLRDRINSGIAEARRKGVKLGRPKGTILLPEQFNAKHRDIIRQLKAGPVRAQYSQDHG